MGASPDSEGEAIPGFACLHRVAQSYLGPLWLAADVRGGAVRLLRRIALPSGTSPETRAELAALGERARELAHPNVLGVLEALDKDGVLAFAYEQAEAEPLRSLQSWANLRGLSFPVGVALRIMVDLLQGVAEMHALAQNEPGLRVAGGLSPDSVLIARSGGTKLCDPLIAGGAAAIEGIGFNTAKLAYAAPEQVRATAPPTARADLFTCAAMLWELLSSRRLLAGSRPALERKLLDHDLPGLRASLRNPEQVSDELVTLVEQSLSADPLARPASAAELAAQLTACGHELASLDDVAAFVGKLSGPRFDRAAAAVRSRVGGDAARSAPRSSKGDQTLLGVPTVGLEPASEVDTPRADPFGPSTRRGSAIDVDDDEGPTETAPLPPISFELPPLTSTASAPERAGHAAAAGQRATPEAQAPPTAPGSARWEPVPPTRNDKQKAASGASPISPFGSRTIVGLGEPEHPALAPSAPFSNLTPRPFAVPRPAPGGSEREPSAPSAPEPSDPVDAAPAEAERQAPSGSQPPSAAALQALHEPEPPRVTNPFELGLPADAADAGAPPPFEHLLSRSKRTSRPPSNDPGSQSWFELHASPSAAGSLLGRYKLGLGLGLAVVLAAGAWLALSPGSKPSETAAATAERPASSEAPAPQPPAPEPPAAPAPAASDAGAPASAKGPDAPQPAPGAAAADAPPGARAADFAAAKLDDSQLVVLFALEGRKTLPSCPEGLGGKRPGGDARKARQQLDGAQQKLAGGDALAAYELACSAAAHAPNNVAAQRLLAELALELGDPARAKAAVDKALARAPKDKALIALRGDVLAMMGDMTASRAAWLRTAPARGSKAARTKRLVTSYKKLGDKALAASRYGQAAAYHRRAVILTRGAHVQSFGLSEALLGLGRTQAALLWAERAAQALPKDSRWQVLFGDALYENGQSDRARGAWQAALDAQPNNRAAARRLREGKPE